MRYVSKGKFEYIVEKEIENLKCNSDIGLYESSELCELDENDNLDKMDWEYYENFIYDIAYKNVSRKYKIK